MKLPEKSFEFILKEPLKFASKGEEHLGFKLLIESPQAKHRDSVIRMKQMFFKAITSMGSKDTSQESAKEDDGTGLETLTGEQVLMMLYMADIDMVKFYQDFRFVLGSGVAKLEGTVPLTNYLVDQIDYNDLDGILGEYIAHFLLSSWTQALLKN